MEESDPLLEDKESVEIKNEIKTEIISWIKVILFSVIFALFMNNFIIVNAKIPSGSMRQTIMENDRIVAFRHSYLFAEPERYDIIVFRFPDNEKEYFIKRIIGLPGEKIEVKDGKIYIDDSEEPLRSDFINTELGEPYGDWGPDYIPEDSYFMMGDNRNNSDDSRKWKNTFLKKEKILGKAVFRYFPKFKAF